MPATESQSDFKVGGETVTLINDSCYAKVRENFGFKLEWLAEPSFSFGDLKEGGGKGGGLMAWTKDHKFVVKDVSGDDHATLLKIPEEYCAHVCGDSYLARFFMHFQRPNKKYFVVMNSWMPDGGVPTLYDLKGTADDKLLFQDGKKVAQVHKRFYQCHWLCFEACGCHTATHPDRQVYYKGKKHAFTTKFYVTPADRKTIMTKLENDVNKLKEWGLMDYSLLVGMVNVPEAEPWNLKPGIDGQPFVSVYDGKKYAFYLGVIDFLQGWTSKKLTAHYIKWCCAPKPISTVPPPQYGTQFLTFFGDKFIADGKEISDKAIAVEDVALSSK